MIVQNSDGTYGPYNNEITTSDTPNCVAIPKPDGVEGVQGIWHNHTSVTGVTGPAANYPSNNGLGRGDWDALQGLKDKYGPNGSSFDPALWINGPDGETREFRLSDRDKFEGLTDAEKAEGVGLEGTEVSSTC